MSDLKSNKIKVMIADDHPLLREGIIKLLSLEPDIEVVGEAEDGAQAIELARTIDVDVILMDINMPKINGIMATKIIKKEKPNVNIIALTIHNQEEYLFELIRCGISGYVLKDVRPDELIMTIQKTVKGLGYIPPSLTPRIFEELTRLSKKEAGVKEDFNLTSRELEVLQEMAKGLSNKEIGKKLFISEKTVKNHLTNIFQKLEVNDRTQALLFAIKHNMVTPQ
ncbi:MAG: response regulator [Tepidanaerobacteraceae bacterium]|jgi:DNA-binding NarL/FixJ family response regulator|nr:response regulator transcription factor [Thermoanaerobacterales bacterium]